MDSKFSLYKTKVFAVALFVALLTLLVYLPALQNGFVNWDDNLYVYENPFIQSIDFNFLEWMFTSFYAANWHPLTWLSHAIDYSIWGLNPIGHHLTSIIIHGLNTFLVFLLVVKLMETAKTKELHPLTPDQEKQFRIKTLIVSTVTALLFGIHPIHVESVVWVSERKDVLYAFFFLLSLLSYLKYASPSAQKKQSLYYIFCLFFFILSLMSKPMAVTLPIVLLILDIYPLERLNLKHPFDKQKTDSLKVFIEKIPFFLLSLASSLVTVIAQKKGGAMVSLEIHPLGERILVGIRALWFYLLKMVWPTDLAPLYPYPAKISFLSIDYLGTFIIVLSITAFCIWFWKRQKVFLIAWIFYVITLLPVLGIIQVGAQSSADRYTYLPSLGPFLLTGIGFSLLCNRFKNKIIYTIIVSLLILVPLSIKTIKQINIWKDSLTLWNYELKLFPSDAPKAYFQRAEVYEKLKNYNQALEDFKKSIELNPYYESGYISRGLLYAKLGNYQQAIQDFDQAIRINPNDSDLYYNRGLSYRLSGRCNQAVQDFNRAIKLNTENIDAYVNRDMCYMELNNKK